MKNIVIKHDKDSSLYLCFQRAAFTVCIIATKRETFGLKLGQLGFLFLLETKHTFPES